MKMVQISPFLLNIQEVLDIFEWNFPGLLAMVKDTSGKILVEIRNQMQLRDCLKNILTQHERAVLHIFANYTISYQQILIEFSGNVGHGTREK